MPRVQGQGGDEAEELGCYFEIERGHAAQWVAPSSLVLFAAQTARGVRGRWRGTAPPLPAFTLQKRQTHRIATESQCTQHVVAAARPSPAQPGVRFESAYAKYEKFLSATFPPARP